MTPSKHREYKGVEKGEVRDHMTGLELAFVNVAEQARLPMPKTIMRKGMKKIMMPLPEVDVPLA